MAKKQEYKYNQQFFNEGVYSTDKLMERLDKAAKKVNPDFVMWSFKSQKAGYESAKNSEFQPYWADIMVNIYGCALWNSVYRKNGQTKKADRIADLAQDQFERKFK